MRPPRVTALYSNKKRHAICNHAQRTSPSFLFSSDGEHSACGPSRSSFGRQPLSRSRIAAHHFRARRSRSSGDLKRIRSPWPACSAPALSVCSSNRFAVHSLGVLAACMRSPRSCLACRISALSDRHTACSISPLATIFRFTRRTSSGHAPAALLPRYQPGRSTFLVESSLNFAAILGSQPIVL